MSSNIKNLWPTEVMFSKISEKDIEEVTHELLINLNVLSLPGEVSDINLTDKKFNLPVLQNFVNNTVFSMFNEYSEKVFNFTLDRETCKMKAWAANGSDNYSLRFHNHSGAQLSAVFYLLIDSTKGQGGNIMFHDPRFNANRGLISAFKPKHDDLIIKPVTGDVIIFPSYLYHSVSKFYGSTRLILPVDLFIRD